MRRYFIFLLIGFGLAATTLAAEVADLEFNGVRLGQAPTGDMICVRGSCATETFQNPRPIIPTYLKATDITHIGKVGITSPRYDFIDGRLCRIRFKLACESGMDDFCLEAIIEALDRAYGLTLLKKSDRQYNTYQRHINFLYTTRSGAIIRVGQSSHRDGWQAPFVIISDKGLMDEVRLSANPDYVPRELPRRASVD